MNWNGGTLPRASKNAKASISTAQKRHFAKVRGKLRNGLPSSPGLEFSMFEDAKRAGVRSYNEIGRHRAVSCVRNNQKDGESQTALDEFGNVATTIRHSGLVKSLHRKSRGNCSSIVDVERYSVQEGRSSTRSPIPTLLSPRPSSASASKPLPAGTRESSREASHISAAETLEAKRKYLLGTRDWVGLTTTKPVHMKFAGVKDRDLIGKRRSLEERDYLGRNGGDEKRVKTAYSQNKGSIPLHVLIRDDSPTEISIRVGSLKSRKRQRESRNAHHHSESHGSVASEEMLLAPEPPEISRSHQTFGDHICSNGLRSSQLATNEQTPLRLSPKIVHTSSLSHSRSISRSAANGNEGQLGMFASQILAGARGGQNMAHTVHTPRLSHKTRADEDAELRLIFDRLPHNFYENRDSSETAIIDTPTTSAHISNIGATLCATSDSARRPKAAVRYRPIILEPEIKGRTRYQSPTGSAVLLELHEQGNTVNIEGNVEDISAIPEFHNDKSGEQPVSRTATVEKTDLGAVQDERKTLNHVAESEILSTKLSLDEEKLWRDFVFGHDYSDREDAIDGLESPMLPTQDDHDKSSEIAEFDFEEVSFPKSESLRTRSSAVVEALQRSSASYSQSFDLPFILPQASDSSMECQPPISDPSSDDPLAWTPGHFKAPNVIFKKPSKYRGSQDKAPASIRLGQNPRVNRLGNSRTSNAEKSSKQKGREIETFRVLEDEIEDD